MPKLHYKRYLAPVLFASALIVLPLALVITLPLPAAAQAIPLPPPPTPAPPSSTGPTSNTDIPRTPSQSDQSQDQSVETLKVNVEVVQLFFNVKDKHGALVPHLSKENFDLFEDGKPQTIKYFKAESD